MIIPDNTKLVKKAGAWSIALGAVSIAVGVSVGVGAIIIGGKLLGRSAVLTK